MKNLIFILLFFVLQNGFAQQDSIQSRIVNRVDFNGDLSTELGYHIFDTVISKFYEYDESGINGIISTGNPGGAKSVFTPVVNDFGFNFGETLFETQFQDIANSTIFRTNIPFARIAYVGGPKKYQNFNLLFTQNISSQMNLAVKLETFGTDGFYLNQESSNKLFSLQNTFKSRRNKYGYFVKFTVKSGSINENGGILGDSAYLSSLNSDKLNVQVWFDELSTNRYDDRQLELHQFYRFGSLDSIQDKYDGFFLLLDNTGFVKDYWYDNQKPDSLYFSFFNSNINDSSVVTDRSHLVGLENVLSLKYSDTSNGLDVRFGYGLDAYEAGTFISDTSFFAHSLKFDLLQFEVKNFLINSSFKKGLAGFNADGHQFEFSVNRDFLKSLVSVKGYFTSVKTLPDYKFLRYSGNMYSWNTGFGYLDQNKVGFVSRVDSFGLLLSGSIMQTTNLAYFDINALPRQFEGNYATYELRLEKKFVVKSYHFDVNLIYQTVEEQAPVNIPNWIWSVSFYYQKYLFKKALELRYGIDYWQNSSYTADYYVPFTRSFIYQNDYKVGNFPYLDFYISARIKSAQGFVKFQNIGQLVFEKSYMMVPYYPMQDFGMSFGIRWDFFN